MQEDEERRTLLNDKKTSYINNDHHQHHSSRLEWAESSWTRFLYVLCWWWMKPLLYVAYKRSLTVDDLDDIPHVDKAMLLLDRLSAYDWSLTTTWNIVWKEFGKEYIFASLFLIPYLITCIAQPLLFRQILLNIMNEKGSHTVSYMYAISLFISIILQALMHRQNIFRAARVGIRILNALTMMIYIRVLSLKSTSLKDMNIGQIMNLVANDVSKFEELCSYLGYLVEGVLETIIIFGLLCWIMQPIPTLCGFALLPIFILIQLYFGRKFAQYYEATVVCSDKRIQAFSEFIHGCHIVKMYNWEKPLGDRIVQMREHELASIRRASYFHALNVTLFFTSTSLFALVTFGSAWLLGYPLDIANTFPALSFFSLMRVNFMYYLPLALEKISVAKSASRRIDLFMRLAMKQDNHSSLSASLINEQQKGKIMISNASFSWHNDMPCLSLSDLTIEQGTFVGIVGPVGSGKSSLFAAILGEMNLTDGQINTNNSSFSFAAQLPWIFEDTFRNNILLNRPFDQQRYRNVLHACCLDDDISVFGSRGDLIMIGENGINLSGGQKARVSLARALYTDVDIYLLDDPLSAVDHKIAKQIYEKCIGPYGLLKNKTRLIATHQTQFLSESHQIIYLSYGHIDKQSCLNEYSIRENDTNRNEDSRLSSLFDDHKSMDDNQSIIVDEKPLNDGTNWSIWYHFFTAPPFGRIGLCLLIVVFLLGEALNDVANYWLSICLKQSGPDQSMSTKSVYIYFGLLIALVITELVRTSYYFTVVLNGSNNFHNKMLKGLLYTSAQFFESNPSGRILNRASKDQYVIDELLPTMLLESIETFLLVTGALFMISFINPYVFLVFILLVPVTWLIIYFFLRCSRQLKRLESVTRSPVYALFSSSLNGLPTIRALKAENSFIQLIADRINVHTSVFLVLQAVLQWFLVIMSVVCAFIILAASIQLVNVHDYEKSPAAALSLTYAMYVAILFNGTVIRLSEANMMMISGERIDEYSNLPREEDEGSYKGLVQTSPKWPAHGNIQFSNYSLRHRLNLQYAIRNIDLNIEAGQKIGIIGRTGAGKSSLFKGILRFVNRSCVDGKIFIDGVDISRITLNHLRSHLSVIPQQPILFNGTLRYNLDPFNSYSDEQCWMALEDVQLKQFVSNHSAGLLMSISESGKTLSVGQCQLICIARAILKKSKIVLIDEATANVDQKTDDLIQTVLKDKFQDRTVLTIAHRLNTVAKYDRILVLDTGMIVNFDTPTNILQSYC
ncbi:unnamed protein product [Rotaria sp. Silwood1]|nr:unnamed protein product [Rotaria sp. Silwood1]